MARILLSGSSTFLSLPLKRQNPLDTAAAKSRLPCPVPAAVQSVPPKKGSVTPRRPKASRQPIFRGIGKGFAGQKKQKDEFTTISHAAHQSSHGDAVIPPESMPQQEIDAFWRPAILEAGGGSASESEIAEAQAVARRMADRVKAESYRKAVSSERRAEIDVFWRSIVDGVAVTKR